MKHILLLLFSCTVLILSAQSGITWAASTDIAGSSYSNMHPRVALDGSGHPLVIWGRMNDQSVWLSRWSGSAFTTPVKLNPSGVTVATASWMGPDITAKGDTVYVVYRQTPESMDTSKHSYIISSFDGGQTFSSPVRVDHIGDSMTRFPTVAIDDNGNPLVAFMKFNNSYNDARWAVAKSADHGSTFSTDVKASGWSGAGSLVCDCCPGVLVSSGSASAMVYRDNLSDLRNMWTGISTDNASTFTSGYKADNTNWNINFCPSSGPDAVIIGDSLYTVFLSGGSGTYRTYLSKSLISTGSLLSVALLSDTTIPGLGQQNYPRIASDGKATAIVWKQNVSGNANLPILFTNNISKGFPTAFDTVDLGDVTNADVAVANGKVFVAWEDDNSGTIKYRFGTYTQDSAVVTPTAIADLSGNTLSIYPNPNSGSFTLLTSNALHSDYIITDMLGHVVAQQQITSDRQVINMTDKAAGVYSLTIKGTGSWQTMRFPMVR